MDAVDKCLMKSYRPNCQMLSCTLWDTN